MTRVKTNILINTITALFSLYYTSDHFNGYLPSSLENNRLFFGS